MGKPGQDKLHLWVLVTAVNPQTGDARPSSRVRLELPREPKLLSEGGATFHPNLAHPKPHSGKS